MIHKYFKIKNLLGLHIRASDKLVKCANNFISEIFIIYNTQRIDAKRIMQVISAGLKKGDEILVEVSGEDELSAFESISRLIEAGFDEIDN